MLYDSLLTKLEEDLRTALTTTTVELVALARTRLEGVLAEIAEERAEGLAEVAKERADLHREIAAMHTHKEAQEGRVVLNIDGICFETSVQALRRVPHTLFSAYFSGWYAQDVYDDGSIFVDRNCEHFGHVFEYMRDGVVSVAEPGARPSVSLLRALKREFGFYRIELVVEKNVVFVVGGFDHANGRNSASVGVYESASGEWRNAAPMSTPRTEFAMCQVGSRLYVSCGNFKHGDLARVECYGPSFDVWRAAPAMPQPQYGHCACG
jgi:hypothetical protein